MPNRLAQETSPYLQQHAGNPVDWYPWGDEALAAARAQNRPILLSIGYSACHWCHVMAHESFEDAGIAQLMNQHFINIKVDREERPDLDQIYQLALQMLTQRPGGWPLTMFLSPDGTPFFGGTYFPKESRYDLPGFRDLLPRIAAFYQANQGEVDNQGAALREAFARMQPEAVAAVPFSDMPLEAAYLQLKQHYDVVNGGFGGAPKFPNPPQLEFLLRYAHRSGVDDAREMVIDTLRKMADGGLLDQLGGGFYRYSVDAHWRIPHFEKMLYDNGQLLGLYTDAFVLSGEPRFAQVADLTVGWALRDMQSPEGGFYSSLDADSEHIEGKFYTWTHEEIATILTEEEDEVFERIYGLDLPPNFEHQVWHLFMHRQPAAVAAELKQPLPEIEALLGAARARLFSVREQRIHPGRDEKILTSWNALMIKGLSRAGRVFARPDWVDAAIRATDFIRKTLWQDGRLLATYKDGHAHLNAYLDDYAFMLEALLELMQARFRPEDAEFADALAQVLLQQFADPEAGGFYFTSHDHEALITRLKPGFDNAMPAGNGIAAWALGRLGHLLGQSDYLEAAERTVQLFYPALAGQPSAYSSLLVALLEQLSPPRMVLLRGPAPDLVAWQHQLAQAYHPDAVVLSLGNGLAPLPAAIQQPETAQPAAYICLTGRCLPPVQQLDAVEAALSQATETA